MSVKKQPSNNISKEQNKFLEALKASIGNITVACAKNNISRQTYYNWMKNEEFAQAVEYVNETNLDYAESKLMSLIRQENPTAIIFYLKTKGKKRGYIETVEQNVNGNMFLDLMKSLPDE